MAGVQTIEQGGMTFVGATTSQASPDLNNTNQNGCKVLVNVTAIGTGSITATIQGKDKASQTYYTILASAAIVGNGQTLLTVFPGCPATANVSVNDVLPGTWRILITANNANPVTYTVGWSTLD